MKFFYKEQKVRNGYITAFALLMISYLLVFYTLRQMEKRSRHVNHTSETINNLDILLSCIKESENNFRGYLIMNDSAFLEPYRFNLMCVESSFTTIHTLFKNDIVQGEYLDSLRSAVDSNTSLMNIIIAENKDQPLANNKLVFKRLTAGMENMNRIRNLVFSMQTNETEKLTMSSTEIDTSTRALKIIHLTTFIIALLILIYSVLVYNNISIEKLKYRAQLEEGIEKLKIANQDLINLRSIEKFAASGRIARAIAHEIRNPLTSISLAAEQLDDSIKDEENQSLIEIISRGVNRIHVLIQQLMDSTKFAQLKLSRESLNNIVDEALLLAKDRVSLKNIKVIPKYDHDPCMIEADKEKMKIAMLNILVNAIEAIEPEKGIIEITTRKINGKCYVTITDNGAGMDENELSRIFEPFYTKKENGNGLGLTLTQNIVLNHKGEIYAESKPNIGTTFTVSFNNATE